MRSERARSFIRFINWGNIALGVLVVLVMTLDSTSTAHAQTFQVVHTFTGGGDGANPVAGLTLGPNGNLYGTAYFGGHDKGNCAGTGCGTVFKITHHGSDWVFSRLYPFTDTGDGAAPNSRVIFGHDGTLYGTTSVGNNVFNLKPPPNAPVSVFAPWKISLVHQFGSVGDGNAPAGDLVFDAAGNLYGTTYSGGNWNLCGGTGCGRVYQLVRSQGSWMETPLYDFTGQADGNYPVSGVILDPSGNLYGTASQGGGFQFGNVFQLANSGSSWTENTLYSFQGQQDGQFPLAGLIFDPSGNLYGATSSGGSGNGGIIFSLMPGGGNWTFSLLTSLTGGAGATGPHGSLIMDTAGNLYGTTYSDGAFGFGSVFQLTPTSRGWNYTSLYDFTGGADGANPAAGLAMDANGNLFGTTYSGGVTGPTCDPNAGNQCGAVFEIAP